MQHVVNNYFTRSISLNISGNVIISVTCKYKMRNTVYDVNLLEVLFITMVMLQNKMVVVLKINMTLNQK